MRESKNSLSSYFENICLFIIGIFFVVFPLFFLSTTTDAFVLPKQLVLCLATLLFVIFFGLKTVIDGKLKLRNSPFDLPVVLFIAVCFASAFLSGNRYDAYTTFVPLLFVAFLYFGIVNIVRSEKQLLFLLGSLVLGGTIAALFSTLSFLKIYPLPFAYTHVPYFTTFGSLLDQALYVALLIPITA